MQGADGKEQRRTAIRALTRLSRAHFLDCDISRDAGPRRFLEGVAALRDILTDVEERAALATAHRAYAAASNAVWPELAWPESVPPAPTAAEASDASAAAAAEAPEASAAAAADAATAEDAEPCRTCRVQGRDVGMTFNHDWVPSGATVQEWWPNGGVAVVSAFQTWALRDLPARFRDNKLEHLSLTMEQRLRAPRGQSALARASYLLTVSRFEHNRILVLLEHTASCRSEA